MIPHDKIPQLLIDNEFSAMRIFDRGGMNKIFDIEGTSPEDAGQKFISYFEVLKGYGTLKLKVGNAKAIDNNFSGAAQWIVTFPQVGYSVTNPVPAAPAMGMSKEYMTLFEKMQTLTAEVQIEKKKRELEDEYEKKNKMPIPMEYLPFLGELLGWEPEKMNRLLQQSMLAGNPQLAVAAMAQYQSGNVDTKFAAVKQKIGDAKVNALLSYLEANPKIADTLLAAIPGSNLSGANDENKNEKVICALEWLGDETEEEEILK